MIESEPIRCSHCGAVTNSKIILLGKGRNYLCALCDRKLMRSGRIIQAELKNTRYYSLSYALSALTSLFARRNAKTV
jgi:DNA-directed RNA polymerase subunit RPC12/RpoP